jgi:[amino group carrier protein]-lysine/ornithine hydrolase
VLSPPATEELLRAMLEIPSVSQEEDRLAEWLVPRLAGLGFAAERDEAGNVVAEWGTGPREVVLLGHIDTVPGLIPVRLEAGRLLGRGAVDAKGPFAAAVAAVTRQAREGGLRYTLIGAVEEEGSSKGAYHLLAAGRPAPAHLIVLEPSGWDALTLGYKGSLHLEYRLRQAMAHGSAPSGSAVDQAIAFVRTLQDHAEMVSVGKPAFDRLDVRVIELDGRPGDGLEESVRMRIGLRLPLQLDAGELKAWLQEHAAGAQLDFEVGIAAYRAAKSTPLVRAFLSAIRAQGGEPRFKVKSGTSDMNILAPAWGCPALAYGPGDSHLDHTPEEAMELAELDRGVRVLAGVLQQLS